MPFFAAMLRSSSVVWVGPATVALAIWYANREARFGPFDPYATERTAAAAAPLFLNLAVMASCAAWEGGRLRRAGWVALPNARPAVVAAAPVLGPPVFAGIAALLAGLIWKLQMGGVVLPDVRFLPTLVAIVVAWILFGYVMGLLLPPFVSAPALLIGVYCWLALPGTLSEPGWLRYLTGDEISECCALQSDIDPRLLISPLIFAGGLTATSVLLLQTQHFPRRSLVLAALAPLALGIVGGGAVARDLPPDPGVPRAAAQLVCAAGAPRVCVWPEHAPFLDVAGQEAERAAAAWGAFGIAIPDEFSEIDARAAPIGTRSFGPWSGPSQSETPLAELLAVSMIPDVPACAYGGSLPSAPDSSPVYEESFTAEAYPGFAAYDYVLAWFEAAAGVDEAYLSQRFGGDGGGFGSDVLSAVAQVRALPKADQQTWLQHNLTALSTCDVLPEFGP